VFSKQDDGETCDTHRKLKNSYGILVEKPESKRSFGKIKFGFEHNTKADIAQSVSRGATGWTSGIQFPAKTREFSLLNSFQTAMGPS
jgi:hypothetical protein